MVLKYALEFINKKIKEKYKDNIGHGKFKKELKLLEQGKRIKSNVNFDKSFLKLSLSKKMIFFFFILMFKIIKINLILKILNKKYFLEI